MIEVHEPHESIHSFKDALIHIAIITVGLLIAIGLEQTVEWVHHLDQRHQLEADLNAEAVKNLAIMDADYRDVDLEMANLAANRDRVDTMLASGGKIKLAYIPLVTEDWFAGHPGAIPRHPSIPLASAWMTAKESAQVALLPRDEAKFYNRVYLQYDLLMDASAHLRDSFGTRLEFESQFAALTLDPSHPNDIGPDLSRMSVEELHEESRLLTANWVVLQDVRRRMDVFYGGETTVRTSNSENDVFKNIVIHPLTTLPAQ